MIPWIAKGGFEGDLDIKDNGQDAGKVSAVVKFTKPQVGPAGPVKAPPQIVPTMASAVPGAPPAAPAEPPRDPNGKFSDSEILEVGVRDKNICIKVFIIIMLVLGLQSV